MIGGVASQNQGWGIGDKALDRITGLFDFYVQIHVEIKEKFLAIYKPNFICKVLYFIASH
jgi:hypothetical protein